MNKKYALLFALFITLLIASNLLILNSFVVSESPREKVSIASVTDGDTLKLSDGRIIRLVNINSPEKKMPGADLAAEFLRFYINKTIEIEIIGTDKYKRNLARIYDLDTNNYLNLEIVKKGFASKFLVQESELYDFSEAEERAIKSNFGIWQKSSFSDCLSSEIDKIKERVEITNSCPEINFNGWMLKDESRKVYYFGNLSFEQITLHSGIGTANSTDLYWNEKVDIWNNDRDSLYVFDNEGGIAHHETYGY